MKEGDEVEVFSLANIDNLVVAVDVLVYAGRVV
jgi:hypothetical protein